MDQQEQEQKQNGRNFSDVKQFLRDRRLLGVTLESESGGDRVGTRKENKYSLSVNKILQVREKDETWHGL